MAKSISEPSIKATADLIVEEKKAIRVLHVDDDSGFLKTAKSFLEAQGPFEVETALSVEEALRKLGETEYDVVVSDYQMPGKDGLEFLKETKQQDNTIPFVIFTGRGREEVAIKALNLGADGYFNKMGQPETVYGELAHGIRLAVERKRAEMEVLKKEERLRAILASSPDGIMISDLNGNVVDCNEAALKLGGYSSKKEIVGKNSLQFIAEEDRKLALEKMKQIFEVGTIRDVEYAALKKNGETYTAETSGSILKDSAGNPVGFIIVVRDITERKKAEDALRESDEKYGELTESIEDVFFAMDKDFRYTYWNKASEKLTGISAKDAIGKSLTEVFPDVKGTEVERFYRNVLRTKQHQTFLNEYRLKNKDFVFEIDAYPTRDGLSVFVKDISENKKAELTVLESKEKFEALFKGNPEAAVLVDPDSHVLDINSRFQQLFGYDLAEIKGRHIKDLVVPKDKIEEAQSLDDKSVQGYVYRNTVRRRKDGSLVPVSIAGAPIAVEGRSVGYVVVYQDISELKNAEKKLEMMNEKLRVVGGLTRHDVRNKLSAVTGNAYLAREKLPGNSEVLDYLKQIETSVEGTVRILEFAKNYEMLGIEELAYVDVEKAFKKAISAFPGLETVKVTNDCHGLSVRADSLLVQLFYNLIDNSLKHGEKLTKIKVHCADDGDQLNLIYEDDGVGIPRENKLKVFSEGFTTGKGSGYGLYLIRRMIEIYG